MDLQGSLYANELELDENTVTTFASKRNQSEDELSLSEDVNVTFASKRSVNLKPSITRQQFLKKLEKLSSSYVAGELNFYTYDKQQGSFVNLYNKSTISNRQKFAIQVKSFSGDMYFYAFRVRKSRVENLFPLKTGYYGSNPIQEYVNYQLPSSKGWYTINKKIQKGQNDFYFFVSQKKIRDLNRVKSQSHLENILKKYQEKTYTKRILDKARIRKKEFRGELYPTMLGFQNVYAKKMSIFVN